mmetsp:Transcript_13738/g.31958  ORF Transcript_13738/g.31958 Transcript_13738/m.31958 type:complete len:241 (+) Transcript_13738:2-724(+)
MYLHKQCFTVDDFLSFFRGLHYHEFGFRERQTQITEHPATRNDPQLSTKGSPHGLVGHSKAIESFVSVLGHGSSSGSAGVKVQAIEFIQHHALETPPDQAQFRNPLQQTGRVLLGNVFSVKYDIDDNDGGKECQGHVARGTHGPNQQSGCLRCDGMQTDETQKRLELLQVALQSRQLVHQATKHGIEQCNEGNFRQGLGQKVRQSVIEFGGDFPCHNGLFLWEGSDGSRHGHIAGSNRNQ